MNTEPKTTDKREPQDKGMTHDTTRDPDRRSGQGQRGQGESADKGMEHDTARDPDERHGRDKREQTQVNDPTGGARGGAARR